MDGKKIEIRLCQEKDKACWVSLNQEFISFEVGNNSFWNGIEKSGESRFKSTFQKALREPELITLVLIEIDGRVVGFANLMTAFSVWAGGKVLILDDLYIKKAYQGKGGGRFFMAWLESYAIEKGFERLQFQSEFSNPSAKGFYEALGYQSENMHFYVKYL